MEGQIVKACIEWLYLHGYDVIRNNTGSFKATYTRKDGSNATSYIRTGKKGSGDILACSPTGRWVEVECKTLEGILSPEQIARKNEIRRRQGIYIVARSIDDLERELVNAN